MKKLLIGYTTTTLLGILWIGFIVVTGLRGNGFGGFGYLLPVMLFTPEGFLLLGAMDAGRGGQVGLFALLMTLKIAISYGIASFILFLWNRK